MSSDVFIYKCVEYNKEKLKYIINEYFKNIDIKGKKVLIKPNMLQAHKPSECVTTNPVVVEAAAEVIINKGGICSIGDSPSGKGIENARKAAEKTGFLGVCKQLSINFDFFEGQKLRFVKIPDGRVIKGIYLPETYFLYDIVINLPKLKTHCFTVFTLGVKNMYGMISGITKSDFHKKAAHPKRFAALLCDLYSVVKPDYTILDAIEVMEGNGPVTGKIRKLNRIFISDNTNALDATVEKMCGMNPEKIPYTKEVADRKIENITDIIIHKNYDSNDNEFNGFIIPKLPVMISKIPVYLLDLISCFFVREPVVNKELCISCNKCIEACPVEAIVIQDRYPLFIMKKCIKCFCCAERCMESAISEKRKLLARLLDSWRD